MKKLFLISFYICLFSQSAWSMKLTFKGDYIHNNTDNVDSTNVPVKDQYNDYAATLQLKDDINKWKLKYKSEKYKTTKADNNNSIDLSYQYKPSKIREFSISAFQQKYTGTSLSTTDTASDNQGAKISTTLTHEVDKDKNTYLTAMGTYKKYTKLNRQDPLLDLTLGYDDNISPTFEINPELNLEYNNSTDGYYKNINWGPSLTLTLTPNEKWEIFGSISYTSTNYSGRTITITPPKGKSYTTKENQEIVTTSIGTVYNLFDVLDLSAKYTNNRNSSNNNTNAYASKVTTFSISLRI